MHGSMHVNGTMAGEKRGGQEGGPSFQGGGQRFPWGGG
jgi:hypothetical protein